MYQYVYGTQLGDFPGFPLLDQVESYARGETIKKASVFTLEELERFLLEADQDNRYWLVRMVVAVVSYCGGNRLHEVKELIHDDVQLTATGYVVTFQHAKQRKHVAKSS